MVSILRPGQWVVQNVQTSVQPMVSWSTRSHASWNLVEMMITTKCASLEFKKGHDMLFGTWSAVALGGRSVRVHGVASEGR